MITALTDPNQLPNQLQDQQTFDANMAHVIDMLPERARQENELAANMGMFAAGGAYAFPYVFDSSTADADPGAGKLRLGSATQNAATVMRIDLQAVGGADLTNVLADLRAATSSVKGSIRVVKMTDPSKWLIFDVTAVALPTGYRNLTVNWRATGGGSASPFANGDALMVFIDRNGDSGTVPGATELLATIPVPNGVAAVNALNVFDADHDWYFIHFSGIRTSAEARLVVQLAVAGALASGAQDYLKTQAGAGAVTTRSTQFILDSGQSTTYSTHSGILQIGDVNSATMTAIIYDGISKTSDGNGSAVAPSGFLNRTSAASGFGVSIFSSPTTTFAGGTIRVYGVRKQ